MQLEDPVEIKEVDIKEPNGANSDGKARFIVRRVD